VLGLTNTPSITGLKKGQREAGVRQIQLEEAAARYLYGAEKVLHFEQSNDVITVGYLSFPR